MVNPQTNPHLKLQYNHQERPFKNNLRLLGTVFTPSNIDD